MTLPGIHSAYVGWAIDSDDGSMLTIGGPGPTVTLDNGGASPCGPKNSL